MTKPLKIFYSCLSLLPVFPSVFFENQASAYCEVGNVLFRDTIFGALIGTAVGGLVVIAANEPKNKIAADFATGALVGIGAGMTVGIFELYYTCSKGDDFGRGYKNDWSYNNNKNEKNSASSSFHIRPLLTYGSNNTHVSYGNSDNNFSTYSKTNTNHLNLISGLTLSYDIGR